jgi:ubiquitin-protein ligase
MLNQARVNRLRDQQRKLLHLAERSDCIRITPERYFVNYLLRSITGINAQGEPQYGDAHQMELYLTADYPNAEPSLKFLTPIWHPNISSQAPRSVCTDAVNSWWAAKDLDELVVYVGELVQYRHYHAKWEAPFPKDRNVAEWVLNYAEPRGIVGAGHPTDERSLRKPLRIYQGKPVIAEPLKPVKTPKLRIHLGAGTTASPRRITLGKPNG